jgi:hypothetical protein
MVYLHLGAFLEGPPNCPLLPPSGSGGQSQWSQEHTKSIQAGKKYIHYNMQLNYLSFTFPRRLSLSFKNFDERMAATKTLRAPRGVTIEAGANA